MNVQVQPATSARQTMAIIDCDIHPLLRKPGDIKQYLAKEWHEHFEVYGNSLRQPFSQGDIYPKIAPYISRRDAFPPNGGPPGSDLAFMQEQMLDPFNVEYGILQVLAPSGSNQRNVLYGAALCAAINDWQLAEWTGRDKRLKGSLVVAQEDAEGAVAEIRRHRDNRDFAQVSVPSRCLEPLGRRRYWPIYAAIVETGMPLGIHSSGLGGHAPVPGGGWCSYYAEQHHLLALGMQSLITSMVIEGVFEEFPDLRVVIIEGGFTWVPALAWRLDSLWQRLRSEVPQVKRPPSEIIREHFWFSTQPMEEVENPEHMRKTFDWVGWDRLVYSSDYPHWDFDDMRYAFPFTMSADEKAKIFNANARAVYRLD